MTYDPNDPPMPHYEIWCGYCEDDDDTGECVGTGFSIFDARKVADQCRSGGKRWAEIRDMNDGGRVVL